MKPLLVLLAAFGISMLIVRSLRGTFEIALSGRIAMSVMLVVTAVAHFIFTHGMSMMLPDFVPFKTQVIYVTGVIEIAAAIGLLIPDLRIVAAWLLIVFLLLILPANIHAAINHIDYQTGSFDGNGLTYLWLRIPLQILFITWTYLSAIKRTARSRYLKWRTTKCESLSAVQ